MLNVNWLKPFVEARIPPVAGWTLPMFSHIKLNPSLRAKTWCPQQPDLALIYCLHTKWNEKVSPLSPSSKTTANLPALPFHRHPMHLFFATLNSTTPFSPIIPIRRIVSLEYLGGECAPLLGISPYPGVVSVLASSICCIPPEWKSGFSDCKNEVINLIWSRNWIKKKNYIGEGVWEIGYCHEITLMKSNCKTL